MGTSTLWYRGRLAMLAVAAGAVTVFFLSSCSHRKPLAEDELAPAVAGSTHRAMTHVNYDLDVAVIGGGLSGLTAALELRRAGLNAHVFEIMPRVGGRVRTVRYKWNNEDVSVDSGMEEYWESNLAVKYIRALGLPHRADIALSSMVHDGQRVTLTSDDEDFASFQKKIFSEAEAAALKGFKKRVTPLIHRLMAWQAANEGRGTLPKDVLALKDISFEEYVLKKEKLPRKVAEWIRISVECEAGTEWNRISALDGLAEFHIFLGDDGGEKSFRIIAGNDAFTNALADGVGRKNISLDQKVTKIERIGSMSIVHVLDQNTNEQYLVRARHVVSTIPLYRLFQVQFNPPLSPKKWQAIQSQSYGSYFKAHVFLPKSAESFWTAKNGVSSLPILSDSEAGVIYDGNPDHEGNTKVLSLLVHGGRAEAFNFMPGDLARAQIKHRLDQIWPGIGAQIQNMEFYSYHPRAIAAWPPGRSRFDELSQEIRRPENGLYLAGDFTETSHSDGAFLSALRVTKQILRAEGRILANTSPMQAAQ